MYLHKKRFWGASQWVSYLWCCHQQPRHETVTPLQPSPFVKRWKIGLKILEETKNWKKGLVGRKVYVLCLCYEEEEEEEEREMGLREEELCIEIRPTKIPIPQSKIRPDFIPNLANFPSWSWITGQAMRNYKIKTRNKE